MEVKKQRGNVIQKCKTLPSSSPKDAINLLDNSNGDLQYTNKPLNLNGIYSKPKDIHRLFRKNRSVTNLTSVEDIDIDIELEGTSRIIPIYNHHDYNKNDRFKLRNKSCDNTQYISLPSPDSIKIKDDQPDKSINEIKTKIKALEKENQDLQKENQRLKGKNIDLKTKLSNKEIEDNSRLNSGRHNNITNNKELNKLNQENQELKLQIKQLQIKLKEKGLKNHNANNNNKLKKYLVKNEIKSFLIQGIKPIKSKHNNTENEYKILERKYHLVEKEKEQLKKNILQYKSQSNKAITTNKTRCNYNSNPKIEKAKKKNQEESVDLWDNDDPNGKYDNKKFEDDDEAFKNKNDEEETRDSNWVNSQYKDKDNIANAKEADFFEDAEDFYIKTEKEIETKRDMEKKSPIMELMNDKTFGLCWNQNKKGKSTQDLKQKTNKLPSNNSMLFIKQKTNKNNSLKSFQDK